MSDWYYAVNNEQKGPVSEADLKGQLAANRIPADSLVWKDGMANWTPANELPTFAARAAVAGGDTLSGVTLTGVPSSVARTPGADNPESVTPVSVAGLMSGGEALEVDAEDAGEQQDFRHPGLPFHSLDRAADRGEGFALREISREPGP